MTTLHDRYRGCLIGGAAGDALGYPVEFARLESIYREYGKAGIRTYALFPEQEKAIVTDDTQMTLFTACGLLRCVAALQNGEQAEPREYIRQAYLDWFYTQRFASKGVHAGKPVPPPERAHTWLMNVPWLYAWRAPGNTCLSALSVGADGTFTDSINLSKGCGGVMRAAPAGLYAQSAEEAMRIGAEAAALTHGHPLGYIPAGELSYTVYCAAHTEQPLAQIVSDALDAADRMFADIPDAADELPVFRALTEQALRYAEDDCPDTEALDALGEGWVGEEAFADAVYCAVRHQDDFSACLCAAVNHDGDSDSTGAVAGNILGARLGASAIPAKWTEQLEGVPELTQIADDLYRISAPDDAWRARYLR